MPNDRAHKARLNMLAVQIAAEFPGTRAEAEYVLARVRRILEEFVYEEPATRAAADLVRLSVVKDDRAS